MKKKRQAKKKPQKKPKAKGKTSRKSSKPLRSKKTVKFRKSKALEDTLKQHGQMYEIKKQIDYLWEFAERSDERIQDIEIHLNLLTRLFTTLCIEKFGMRIGVLKRIIKRIEKETIRDSQISHLESLYSLPAHGKKHTKFPPKKSKNDPWEDIS